MKGLCPVKSNSAKGFTIIESTLVVMVIGMLAVIAIPRILSMDRHVVHATVRQVTADLRYTRNLAVTNMEDHVVKFSPAGGPYTKYEIFSAGDLVNPIKSREIPTDVTCTAVAGGFAIADEITFATLGSTTSTGQIILVSEPAGSSENVTVISATGRVYLNG